MTYYYYSVVGNGESELKSTNPKNIDVSKVVPMGLSE